VSTNIDYVDESWNPVTGCTPVSAGCENCYAAKMAHRFWGDRPFSDVRCHEDRLTIPYTWGPKVQRVLVPSMGDLFHEDVPFNFIHAVFKAMYADCGNTVFMLLTKRPLRMRAYTEWIRAQRITFSPWKTGIWFGTSIENQEQVRRRIGMLPWEFDHKWISFEPLLESVSLRIHMTHVSWVIAGAETGPGARPCNPDWLRSLRDQCQEAGVPFWIKQINNKREQELDGRVWKETPRDLR